MQMTPNCMVIVHLPILLSWRLEFFELLTQFTSGCPRTGSISTQARHNSSGLGLVRNTVLPRGIQIGCSVYFRPWLNLHPWGILASLSIKSWTWRIISPNSASRVTISASPNTHGSALAHIISHPNSGPCFHLHASLDFSNSLLYGTNAYLLDRLQSVRNSAARLILRIGKHDPISAAIRRDLHWLPIQFRIQYKLNSITSNCLTGRAPEYLIELCHSVNDIPARRNLRSSSQVQLLVPRYRKERSRRRGFSVSLTIRLRLLTFQFLIFFWLWSAACIVLVHFC